MAYLHSENHNDALTTNGFRFELGGRTFEGIIGVAGWVQGTGSFEWVDGQTGIAEWFSDQKINSGPLSITFRVDPTKPEFSQMRQIVQSAVQNGVRYDFTIVKYNHSVEIFRIAVYKALFKQQTWADLNKNESSPYDITMDVDIAWFEIV